MVKYMDNNSGFNMWNANKNNAAKKPSAMSGFLWWAIIFMLSFMMLRSCTAPKTAADMDTAALENAPTVTLVNVGNENISAGAGGLRVTGIKLANFMDSAADGTGAKVLLPNNPDTPEFAEIGLLSPDTATPTIATKWRAVDNGLMWRNADGVEYRRTYDVDGYVITVTDEIKNNTKRDLHFAPYARIVRTNNEKSSAGVYSGAVAYANGSIDHNDWRKLDTKSYAYTSPNGFVGFADQYWETLVSIDSADQTMRVKKSGTGYQADTSAAAVTVGAGNTHRVVSHVYAGPRDAYALRDAAAQMPGIAKTMDYGWFWFLAQPMLWALNMLNAIVMNYGIAIIVLTILVRMLMWPLTRKSYTSMIAMQKMQPEMARIQKLYANDKTRMQMEMMRLYQTHKTSPMSGCLPMLIQIPIFFALYKALLISVPMRGAHFLWIHDLAAMDPYFILPILMGLTMFLQQHLQSVATPKNAANDAVAQTQRAMKWMPALFTLMFAWMPAGLVLYWTVSNLFGIAQMYIIKRTARK